MSTAPVNKRRQSRIFAMQALFQWHFTQEAPDILLQDFIVEHVTELKAVDLPFCRQLFLGAVNSVEKIDGALTPLLSRDITSLNPVELSILRLAVYELQNHPETPKKVVVNEAIELAKGYGAVDGYKFVNGVLNAALRELFRA
ncbi:MAG: transcription antitermination factor NusB [Coxiellaceae bacterium]|nr:transcription antitermination factor NusB [Coxiellaceae bacterium]